MTPEEEFREAATTLWSSRPYGVLSDPLANLLDALADDMAQQGAVEGSASRAVHPVSPLGVGLSAPRRDWTAALDAARIINCGAS